MEITATVTIAGRDCGRKGRPVGQSDILDPSEIRQVLASVRNREGQQGSRDYAILLVLANTPIRKGELVRLNLEDLIDRGSKFITYKALKKRSGRVMWMNLPISDAWEKILF